MSPGTSGVISPSPLRLRTERFFTGSELRVFFEMNSLTVPLWRSVWLCFSSGATADAHSLVMWALRSGSSPPKSMVKSASIGCVARWPRFSMVGLDDKSPFSSGASNSIVMSTRSSTVGDFGFGGAGSIARSTVSPEWVSDRPVWIVCIKSVDGGSMGRSEESSASKRSIDSSSVGSEDAGSSVLSPLSGAVLS